MTASRPPTPRRQRGVALSVVLILLVVMTLIGLASLRGTLLEEKMTSNMRDRSLAFESAEAALRQGEAVAAGRPSPAAGCTNGMCGIPDPTATSVWLDEAVWANAPAASVPAGSPAAKYIVELIADNVPAKGACTTSGDVSETTCSGTERRYRISARSNVAGRANVMLQSLYSVP